MIDGNRLLVSHYTEGVHLLDVRQPGAAAACSASTTPIPGGPGGFNGAWGAYIFPGSNLIVVSDINGGLFVIEYTGAVTPALLDAARASGRGDVVAVVGAGGQDDARLPAGRARRARAGLRVLVTTTTHMGTLAEAMTGPVLVEDDGEASVDAALAAALATERRATVLGRRVRAGQARRPGSGARGRAARGRRTSCWSRRTAPAAGR